MIKILFLILLTVLVSACGSTANRDGAPRGAMLKSNKEVLAIPDAVPRREPLSKYGNPVTYVVMGKKYSVLKSSENYRRKGVASWYGTKFHGRRTSSGEPYDMYAMTAAHKSLPLPTYVRVTNLKNNRKVIVKVNDRGPFHDNRIIDLSYAAAIKLGIAGEGTGLVEVEVVKPQSKQPVLKKTAYKNHKTVKPVNGHTLAVPPGNRNLNLFVQVGAFSSRDSAHKVQSRLLDSSINNVQISRVNHKVSPVYRVRVGPVKSVEKADKIAARISSLGFGESAIIVE